MKITQATIDQITEDLQRRFEKYNTDPEARRRMMLDLLEEHFGKAQVHVDPENPDVAHIQYDPPRIICSIPLVIKT